MFFDSVPTFYYNRLHRKDDSNSIPFGKALNRNFKPLKAVFYEIVAGIQPAVE